MKKYFTGGPAILATTPSTKSTRNASRAQRTIKKVRELSEYADGPHTIPVCRYISRDYPAIVALVSQAVHLVTKKHMEAEKYEKWKFVADKVIGCVYNFDYYD